MNHRLLTRRMATMAFLTCLTCAPAWAVTIYVDRNQTTNTEDGLTWGTAWTNFAGALAHLAATNAVVSGGHTVVAAAGTYVEQVVLTPAHAGTAANSNTFQASGNVIVGGKAYGFYLTNGTHDVVLDGLKFAGCTADGVYTWYATNGLILRCDSYGNGGSGFYISYSSNFVLEACNSYSNIASGFRLYRGGGYHVVRYANAFANANHGIALETSNGNIVSNCVVYANTANGVDQGGCNSVRVINCIIALCSSANGAGFAQYSGGTWTVANNCFYGNRANLLYNSTAYDVNYFPGSSNNIVALPSFSGLRNGWDFSRFYTDSPCLGTGAGGAHMGSTTNPTLDSLSSNTYYVNAATGDDSRTKTDATNPATPWKSVTNAAAKAVAGDTIHIASGVYTGTVSPASGSYTLPLQIVGNGAPTLRSTNGYGLNLDRLACVDVSGVVATGITRSVSLLSCIRCSLTDSEVVGPVGGSGVYLDGDGYSNAIRNVMVHDTANGIHVAGHNEKPSIQGCTARNCTTYGLHLFRYMYNGTIDACTVYSNVTGVKIDRCPNTRMSNMNAYDNTTGFYIQYVSAGLTFENNNVFRNGTGMYLYEPYTGPIRNCTIVSNTSYGIREAYDVAPVCSNNCFYQNNGKSYYEYTSATSYNTVAEINGLSGFVNNIVADPLFVSPASNFRLVRESPCIDAGTPTTTLATDYYGNRRKAGIAVDIGIYERQPPPCTVFVIR